MLLDLSLEVVSALFDPNRVLSLDTVCFICEIACSAQCMHQCAPERIVKLVLMRRVRDPTSVRENDRLASFNIQVNGIHVDSRRE